MRFSRRMGLTPIRDALQKDAMDDALRSSLWNVLAETYWQAAFVAHRQSTYMGLALSIWTEYFKRLRDDMPRDWDNFRLEMRRYFTSCDWYYVYDFIEFIANANEHEEVRDTFTSSCNDMLEREMSAYRFVGTQIAPITSDQEIAAIENAVSITEASDPLRPIAVHLQQAVTLMADRASPDHRNSMKESISAVEALCKLITGDDKATLGAALNKIETKKLVPMHPQLKAAFQSLYSYSSDAGGIRHALKDEPDVELEDATFPSSQEQTYLILLSNHT
jgi:AbiJ-like protein